ncbi:MAG: hypothetical protein JSS50_04285 [Proteobacteria bacterium]|nr:hypothetical protein [Pseudomonadota bacterium]
MTKVKQTPPQSQHSKNKRISPAFMALKPALLVALTLCLALLYLSFLSGVISLRDGAVFVIATVIMFYVALLPYFEDINKVLQHLRAETSSPQQLPQLSGAMPALADELKNISSGFRYQYNQLEIALVEATGVLNAIPAIIIVVDSEMKVISINSFAKERLGENVLHQDLAISLPNTELTRGVAYVFRAGKAYKFSTLADLAPKGLYDIHIDCIKLAGVDKRLAVIFINDANSAKRSEEVITDFIANVSHEIRTPLTSVVGAIDVLEYTNWDVEAVKEFMPVIRGQTDRMCALANQLITLLNIERTQYGYDFTDVNVLELLKLVLKQLEYNDYEADITLPMDILEDLPMVFGNPWELEHAIYQVIHNAILHSGGKKVVVATGITQIKAIGMVYISVSDEGEGIPEEHIDRIMEKFYRIDASRSRKAGGNGLGLSIVREIVLKHRGSISIQNREVGGSAFTIYLPHNVV